LVKALEQVTFKQVNTPQGKAQTKLDVIPRVGGKSIHGIYTGYGAGDKG
jgi:hypothetical protein